MVDTVAVSDKDPLIIECPPNPPREGDSPRQVWEISPGVTQGSAIRAKRKVRSSGGASGMVVGFRD